MMNVTLTTSSISSYEDPRNGGWAYFLRYGSNSGEGSGRTKNGLRLRPKPFLERLEIIAVIKGLERLKVPCEVLLISESDRLLRCVSSSRFVWREEGWKKSGTNTDLWQRLDEAAEKHIIDTQLIGEQSGDPDLKRCDDLAWSQASWFPEWFTG
jgi:ribonuclease HI